MSRRPTGCIAPHQLTIAWQTVSLLLDYPDTEMLARLEMIRGASHGLPVALGDSIRGFAGHLEQTTLPELQAEYVETFDNRRRCNLFLTYFAHGDTRKRGMALLRFTHAYKQAGQVLCPDELPDHLSVVCEFAATADLPAGLRLLAEHRAGVELIRLALDDVGSPYVHALDLVRAVLPELHARDLATALALAATGPPAEEVGLEPFAPPEYMGDTGGRR